MKDLANFFSSALWHQLGLHLAVQRAYCPQTEAESYKAEGVLGRMAGSTPEGFRLCLGLHGLLIHVDKQCHRVVGGACTPE